MVDGGAELVKSVGPDSPVGIGPVNELLSSNNSLTSDNSPISVGIVPVVPGGALHGRGVQRRTVASRPMTKVVAAARGV